MSEKQIPHVSDEYLKLMAGMLPTRPADFWHDEAWRAICEAQNVVKAVGTKNQRLLQPELAAETDRAMWGRYEYSMLPKGEALDELLHTVLKEIYGYEAFRGVQLSIIKSLLAGRDTLGLMPTGGGKSLTFQVPGLLLRGTCLVITPLIALMKDQVRRLAELGIMAAAVHADLPKYKVKTLIDNAVHGAYKFLFVSPERLMSGRFLEQLAKIRLSFVVVDEAHCISQWGYDFRPAYLQIGKMLAHFQPAASSREVPLLALTATATGRVVDDIQEKLDFREPNVFRMGFARENLHYRVCPAVSKEEELLHLLQAHPGTAIVYVRSRRATRDIASFLMAEGITAEAYHAGMQGAEKQYRQEQWQSGDVRVIVATNAFGMGIDKADVRLVVHMDIPDSLEAYFQEAGRAGRDGAPAEAVLLTQPLDFTLLSRRVAETFPPKEYLREVYDHLAYYFTIPMGEGAGRTYELNIDEFCRNFHHFPVRLVSALQLLSQTGYIHFALADEWNSRVFMLVPRDDLYRLYGLSTHAEAVLLALLRLYTGLFSDYVFIEEETVAQAAGLDANATHEALKELTKQRVLHYIPRKCVPRVTYLSRRTESEELWIPTTIYEDRRELYRERIDAMLHYATSTDTCRAQILLRYFDDDCAPCGHCDVCAP